LIVIQSLMLCAVLMKRLSDYTVHQLPGMIVLWTTSDRIINHQTAMVTVIDSTTPKGFTIFGVSGRVFDYFTGYEKSINHRPVNRHSKCRLISEKERKELEKKIYDSKVDDVTRKIYE